MDQPTILDRNTWLLWSDERLDNQLFVERSISNSPQMGNTFDYCENYYVVRQGSVLWIGPDLAELPHGESIRRLRWDCECLGEYSPEKIPPQRCYEFDLTKFQASLRAGQLSFSPQDDAKIQTN